jgi:hypothetical protein
MDAASIVVQLKQELARIDQAISALEQLGQTAPRRGRPPKAMQATQSGRRGPRVMSAAARAKIAAAQRARWAKQKSKAAAATVAPKKTASKRKPMSPAVKKRLSAMMKARWAARKKAA